MKFPIKYLLILAISTMLSACGERPLPPNAYGTQGNSYPPVQQSSFNNQSAHCSSPPYPVSPETLRKLQQPYSAGGERFFPITDPRGFVEVGEAAWYGAKFDGKLTASGEVYDQNAMTAAHPGLPMNTCIRVENISNNAVVYLRINDRGPSVHRRVLDVSVAAAKQLGFYRAGVAKVRIDFMY